mmetsp:Transcript_22796/g.60044  ORF Transcript_22796/g.60044 Transcript_22796/m.60044 type:complete len:224 (-) Transcript_22796:252-923(-)
MMYQPQSKYQDFLDYSSGALKQPNSIYSGSTYAGSSQYGGSQYGGSSHGGNSIYSSPQSGSPYGIQAGYGNYGGYSSAHHSTWSWKDLLPGQRADYFYQEPYNHHCHSVEYGQHHDSGFFRGTMEKLGIVSDADTLAANQYADLVGEMEMVLRMYSDGALRKDNARRQADIIMDKMQRLHVNRPELVDHKLAQRGISLGRRAQMAQEYKQLRRGPLGVVSCCC